MFTCVKFGLKLLSGSPHLLRFSAIKLDISTNLLSTQVNAVNRLCATRDPCTRVMFSIFTGVEGGGGSDDVGGGTEKIWAEKSRLRQEMKRRLATISVEEKERQSEVVRNKLFQHEVYKKSERISIFLSMDDEIRTLDILRNMFEQGKTVFIPRYSGKLGRMDMVLLNNWEDYESLPVTRWNIKQPSPDDNRPDALLTGGLDMVIMPGLAFTAKGHRLGRGKGYYDSFLSRAAAHPVYPKPFTVAVAFKQQLLPHIPTTDADVLINEVLYENP